MLVTNCRFACRSPFELIGNETFETTTIYPEKDTSASNEADDDVYDERDAFGEGLEIDSIQEVGIFIVIHC